MLPRLRRLATVFACTFVALHCARAQSVPTAAAALSATILNDTGAPLDYANVLLHRSADSSIAKVEVTDPDGRFLMSGLTPEGYFVTVKYVGLPDLITEPFVLAKAEERNLGELTLKPAGVDLAAATVTAERRIVEVKADRTVFNVEGTVNSVGGDGLSLLAMAPGVMLDNNDNIIVMGRTGALVYIDGKRSPLSGAALATYLQSLPAEQLDRIEIITNPGAKYEAEGSAGIIDIRLKKNELWGSNATLTATASQGRRSRSKVSATVNHREGRWNTFATGGVNAAQNVREMDFATVQNDILIDEFNGIELERAGGNLKLGTDFRANDRHAFGILASVNYIDKTDVTDSRVAFSPASRRLAVDSVLRSRTVLDQQRLNLNGNLNYSYRDGKGTSLSVDLDYGAFRNESSQDLPSQFFGPGGEPLSSTTLDFDTPSDIDIYIATADYAQPLAGGQLGLGAKYTRVLSDNTFRAFREIGDELDFDEQLSNEFLYDERVTAAYATYALDFGPAAPAGKGKAYAFSLGLRAEHTNAAGDLVRFDGRPDTTAVDRQYANLFPSATFTWNAAAKHRFGLSYGRRINRPDYATLNPFFSFLSLVSFQEGNPTLLPEIVNSVELSHTFASRYTTKLSYARTEDQITRLVFRADDDPRANFITYENLASQEVLSLSVAVPGQLAPWWEIYFSADGSYVSNRGSFEDGAVVDVDVFNYGLFAQNAFKLPAGVKLELSGRFIGPAVWGGTFVADPRGAVGVGLQKRFLANKLKARLAASDIFFTLPFRAVNEFDGISAEGGFKSDTRRVSLSLSYRFGNAKVKVRPRKTGLREAARRTNG